MLLRGECGNRERKEFSCIDVQDTVWLENQQNQERGLTASENNQGCSMTQRVQRWEPHGVRPHDFGRTRGDWRLTEFEISNRETRRETVSVRHQGKSNNAPYNGTLLLHRFASVDSAVKY